MCRCNHLKSKRATWDGLTWQVGERTFSSTKAVSSDSVRRWVQGGEPVSSWLRWIQDRRGRRAPVPCSEGKWILGSTERTCSRYQWAPCRHMLRVFPPFILALSQVLVISAVGGECGHPGGCSFHRRIQSPGETLGLPGRGQEKERNEAGQEPGTQRWKE